MIDLEKINRAEAVKYRKLGEEEYLKQLIIERAYNESKWYIDRCNHLMDLHERGILSEDEYDLRMFNIP